MRLTSSISPLTNHIGMGQTYILFHIISYYFILFHIISYIISTWFPEAWDFLHQISHLYFKEHIQPLYQTRLTQLQNLSRPATWCGWRSAGDPEGDPFDKDDVAGFVRPDQMGTWRIPSYGRLMLTWLGYIDGQCGSMIMAYIRIRHGMGRFRPAGSFGTKKNRRRSHISALKIWHICPSALFFLEHLKLSMGRYRFSSKSYIWLPEITQCYPQKESDAKPSSFSLAKITTVLDQSFSVSRTRNSTDENLVNSGVKFAYDPSYWGYSIVWKRSMRRRTGCLFLAPFGGSESPVENAMVNISCFGFPHPICSMYVIFTYIHKWFLGFLCW